MSVNVLGSGLCSSAGVSGFWSWGPVRFSATSPFFYIPPAGQGSPVPAPAASQGFGKQLGFPQADVTSCLLVFRTFTKFCLCCSLRKGFVLSLSPKPAIRRTKALCQWLTSDQLNCTLLGRVFPLTQSLWLTRHMLTRQEMLSHHRFPSFQLHAEQYTASGFSHSSTAPQHVVVQAHVTAPAWRSVAPGR